jgi:hypothetical protein
MFTWDGFPPDEKCLWIDNFKDWKAHMPNKICVLNKYIYQKKCTNLWIDYFKDPKGGHFTNRSFYIKQP